MRLLSILTGCMIFISCLSGPVPRGILGPEKMQKVMYDLIRIDEFLTNFVSRDSTVDLKKKRSLLYEQAFRTNHTNKKDFYSSYKYYQQHPDIQKSLFDSLYIRLNRSTMMVDTIKHQ